jgi:hypothetical protein
VADRPKEPDSSIYSAPVSREPVGQGRKTTPDPLQPQSSNAIPQGDIFGGDTENIKAYLRSIGMWPRGRGETVGQTLRRSIEEVKQSDKTIEGAPQQSPKANTEETSLPTTWKEAIPYVGWIVLVLGFGLEFVSALVHLEAFRALGSFVGLVTLIAAMLHWKQFTAWAPRRTLTPFLLLLLYY